MAYPPLVRQDGFQLPSPKSIEDDREDNIFHFVSKFPNFADEIATLIETPHVPSHERSTFDLGYSHFTYDTPAHRSRSRSRGPSVGPTRSARRDRRANSISSHVSSTSPPPRPHAIHIPARAGFFVPNAASAPPDSLSLHSHFSPYYAYQPTNLTTDVDALGMAIPITVPSSAPSAPVKPLDPDAHLSEKRRRRRESHNAVERRRRDNINERIGELASLIPGVLFECDGPLIPGEDPFALLDTGLHVLPTEDGLPDLPEESMVKKDPCEDGETPVSPTTIAAIGEQSTIKANKGMILRKSVEYIRYLQQLVSAQSVRGRELEERNRALEREIAMLRGDTSSSSPSVTSSQILSSNPSSIADLRVEDLEMEDACVDESRGRQLGRARGF